MYLFFPYICCIGVCLPLLCCMYCISYLALTGHKIMNGRSGCLFYYPVPSV